MWGGGGVSKDKIIAVLLGDDKRTHGGCVNALVIPIDLSTVGGGRLQWRFGSANRAPDGRFGPAASPGRSSARGTRQTVRAFAADHHPSWPLSSVSIALSLGNFLSRTLAVCTFERVWYFVCDYEVTKTPSQGKRVLVGGWPDTGPPWSS